MSEVSFEIEWQDGDGIRGAELAATFASLRIKVDEHAVTRVFDSRAKTVRDSIYVPLYPLAEWIASNWWFLSHEFENPVKRGDPDFRLRHALGSNTEGYAFPNLVAAPSGSRIGLEWGGPPSPWTRVEFLDRGHESFDAEEFREVCADLVDTVIQRLVSLGIDGTFLQDEWAAILSADDEESTFCETAAALGWDPYNLNDSGRDQVLRLGDQLGHLRREAAPAIDATAPLEDSSAIVTALEEAKRDGLKLRALRSLLDSIKTEGSHPWEVGYDWARRARQSLGLDGQPIPDMSRLADVLGEDMGSLRRATRPLASLNRVPLVDGVVTGGQPGDVSFGLRGGGEHTRRFLFCRALAEAMSGDGDALITRVHTERQQRNRAFAAEFLAPSSGLRQRVSRSVMDREEVDDLAEEFGVSSWVIAHQIENHRIAEVSE